MIYFAFVLLILLSYLFRNIKMKQVKIVRVLVLEVVLEIIERQNRKRDTFISLTILYLIS